MSQCPQCGAQTTVDQAFCGTCGTPLAQPREQTPPPAEEAPTRMRETPPPSSGTGSQPGQPYGAPQGGQQGYGPPQSGPYAGSPQQPSYGPPPGQPGQPPQGSPQQPYGQPGYAQPPGQGQYGAPPPQQYPQGGPGYGAPQGGPGGSGVNVDFARILAGNWVGMAMVAGAAFGVALVLGALFAFTTADDLDVTSAIAMTLLFAGAAFSPDIVGRIEEGDQTFTLSIGQHPLLLTVAALAVAIVLFRAQTRHHSDIKDGLIDAARAALVLTVGLVVLAVAMRIWSPEVTGYGSGTDSTDVGPAGLAIMPDELGASTWLSIPGSIFLGFLLLFVVLSVTCFVRQDWLRGRLTQVHAWLAAPLWGIAALAVLCVAGGLVYLVAILVGDDRARGLDQIMRLVAVLPALGVRMLGLGVFANVGSKTNADDGAGSDSETFDRLPDFADDFGALFWIAPVVALASMVGAVYTVIVKSVDKTRIMRNVLVFLGVLLVAVPVMVRFANAHVSQKADDGDETVKSTTWLGVDGVQTTFFFFLFSILVALVLLLLTNNLDVNAIVGKAKGAAAQARQQGHGGQQQLGQQPQQGWGQQQPPQPGWGQQPPPQTPPQQGYGQQPGWGQQPPPQGPPQQGWGPQPPPQGPPQQGWGQQPPPAPPQTQPGQQPPQQWGQPGEPPQEDGQQWGPPSHP